MKLHIKIILVGKTKDENLKDLEQYYNKLINKFAKISYVEIAGIPLRKGMSAEQVKNEEGNAIRKNLNENELIIVLDEKGKQYSSTEFAKALRNKSIQNPHITFVIGGAYGLSESVKQKADLILSFSKMTFNHELIRIFLLEQLYRGYSIIQETGYHK